MKNEKRQLKQKVVSTISGIQGVRVPRSYHFVLAVPHAKIDPENLLTTFDLQTFVTLKDWIDAKKTSLRH